MWNDRNGILEFCLSCKNKEVQKQDRNLCVVRGMAPPEKGGKGGGGKTVLDKVFSRSDLGRAAFFGDGGGVRFPCDVVVNEKIVAQRILHLR